MWHQIGAVFVIEEVMRDQNDMNEMQRAIYEETIYRPILTDTNNNEKFKLALMPEWIQMIFIR